MNSLVIILIIVTSVNQNEIKSQKKDKKKE